ncbi:MAG TPA: SMC family ATPase [Pseudonocardiaceae bacterium]|jgi:exonuclease SbcC|nr:SMC family ATPase [Pseudonocardiaceae bacterium]
MRPLRLMFDGFGSYREPTEIDLSDVDFFVLTGPTGSGKSTVIDALCFALYGTVPRWGRGNVIRNALAPSTAECRVCLVFEAAGARYVAARHLRRDARGQVHTKEARLDRLDDSVPADAELTKILEASVEQVAEGPDEVANGVTELLGIGYEHFTQCVLLPQGRFAEFLQAKPGDRQDLLIKLLAFAVYEEVGQRARERAKVGAGKLALAEQRLAEIGEVADDEITAAERTVTDLASLVEPVDAAVAEMDTLRGRWTEASGNAKQTREHLTALAELRMPPGVEALSEQLVAADALVAARDAQRAQADATETEAELACAGLTELAVLTGWREGRARADTLRTELDPLRGALTEAETAERTLADAITDAELALAAADEDVRRIDREHRAAALAADLHTGEPCPVCQQTVGALPHHDVSSDVDTARAAVEKARKAVAAANRQHAAAVKQAAGAKAAVTSAEQRLAELVAQIADAPTELDAAIDARRAADIALAAARSAARTARTAAETATRERAALARTEQQAWSELRAGRDRFVALRAPAVDGVELAAAWRILLDWADGQRTLLGTRATELDAAEADLRDLGTKAAAALTALLADHGIDVTAAPARAPVDLATHRARADHDLADVRSRRAASAALTDEVARHKAEQEVADLLGNLLRSNNFERWLCTEALDSLVLEASQTLLQLSGGQYELHRGDRNDLVVVDHNDAGTQRPVNTLSGGETFQASLALALALSSQVVALSGGRRDLNSVFLDEGFGTLDDTTLDTVAATLERLADDTSRMVGIVTHVTALAERVPVQFAVRRDGASSRVRRVVV